MNTTQLRLAGAGAFFLVILLSGLWLLRTGKPYSGLVSTIHKLVALAAGISLAVIIFQINRAAGLSATEWIVTVVTGVVFLAAGISGGLAMTDIPMAGALLTVHRVTLSLAVLGSAATLYLLRGRY
jgi:hypothetical protein